MCHPSLDFGVLSLQIRNAGHTVTSGNHAFLGPFLPLPLVPTAVGVTNSPIFQMSSGKVTDSKKQPSHQMPSSCRFSHQQFTHPSRQAQGLMGRLSGCQGPGRPMRQRWELCPGLAWCSSSNCWEPASPEDKLVTADLAERPVPLGVGFFRCNRNNLTPSSKAGPASPGHPHHRSWPWETDPAWTTREYGTVTSSAAGPASAGDFRQATAKSQAAGGGPDLASYSCVPCQGQL